MAEAIFNTLANETHESLSAGTKVTEGKDNPVGSKRIRYKTLSSPILGSLAGINIELEDAPANQLTPDMVVEADIVISMSELEHEPDYLVKSYKYEHRKVNDPKQLSLNDTNVIRDIIVKRVNELITKIS